jgi:hypothetical protein
VIGRAQSSSTRCDLRDISKPALGCALARRSASLQTHDLRLLDRSFTRRDLRFARLREAVVGPSFEVSFDISHYFEVSARESELQIRSLVESIPCRPVQLDLERLSTAG